MDHSGHGMTMDLPPFTLGRGLEFGRADPFFLVGCLLALGLYGWGVVRLRAARRRAGRWAGRSSFVARCADRRAGDVHRAERLRHGHVQRAHGAAHGDQHALADPAAARRAGDAGAARAAGRRAGAARGRASCCWRCCTAATCGSSRIPAFTIPLFIASLYALYFTPLFDFLMGSQGRAHRDDGALPRRRPGLLLADHGRRPGPAPAGLCDADAGAVRGHAVPRVLRHRADDGERADGRRRSRTRRPRSASTRSTDQNAAGGIAWAFSEIPSVLVLIALLFQWYRSEQRQAQAHGPGRGPRRRPGTRGVQRLSGLAPRTRALNQLSFPLPETLSIQ